MRPTMPLQTACALGSRSCHSAAAGAHWRVEWRVGLGKSEAVLLDGNLSECAAAAAAPSSPLPGSFKRLVEVFGARERVWLSAEARDYAVDRLRLLVRICDSVWSCDQTPPSEVSAYRRLAGALSQNPAPSNTTPDPFVVTLRGLLQSLDSHATSSSVQGPQQTESGAVRRQVAVLVCAEATSLARSWRPYDSSLALELEALARACVGRARPRRHVQIHEGFVPVNGSAQELGARAKLPDWLP